MDKATEQLAKEITANHEVSIKQLYAYVRSKVRIIWLSVGILALIGFIWSVTSPDEYQASSKILSENANSTEGLGGLFEFAGIPRNLGMQSPATLSPDMYPVVVFSDPFLLGLVNEKFMFREYGREMSLLEYFGEYEKKNWIASVLDIPRGLLNRLLKPRPDAAIASDPLGGGSDSTAKPAVVVINAAERNAINKLKARIELERLNQLFELSVKMPDPYVSASLNQMIVDRLIHYVTDYQTEKEAETLEFIQARKDEAERSFLKAQSALAAFRDSNRGLIASAGRSREERLQLEYNLAFNLYNSMSQQLEQAKIRVQESTPVLNILEPPALPLAKSEPRPVLAIFVFGTIGIFAGIFLIFLKLCVAAFHMWAAGKTSS